jgi:hypothetical protein
MSQAPDQFDDLPGPLADDLRRLYGPSVAPSPGVDQAILNRARAHVAGRKRTLLLRRVAGAAAAVVLITAAVIPTIQRTRHPARPPVARQAAAAAAANDVNADGAVDIRDALALQQSINAGRAGAGANDVNGDGVTDRRDVDAIATFAVRLDKGATR